jgi:transcriptional regulator with XRE-family HTH domain
MFGKIFGELRQSENLTQNDIAKILNVAKSTIGMWEQGRRVPDDKMLIKISKYFEVTLDKLLGLENDKQENLTADEKELIEFYKLCSDEIKEALLVLARNNALKNTIAADESKFA